MLNDLTADSRGGVYVAISGGGLLYANPQGVMTQYGEGVNGANGIILSAGREDALRHERHSRWWRSTCSPTAR